MQREGTWESSGPEQMSEFEGSKEHLQGRGWSWSGPEPEEQGPAWCRGCSHREQPQGGMWDPRGVKRNGGQSGPLQDIGPKESNEGSYRQEWGQSRTGFQRVGKMW